ncbi:DUF4166 domain-containing protein [Roseibium sp. HPY-6]|uniref:DUF4166 domain-containing protein n=1 Tax=Roseibium sp. HPY-6 TaxID=3229852 RepID=UPI00338D4BB6
MQHDTAARHCDIVLDTRFRDLLGEAAWNALPISVRKRFGKRLRGGASVVYQGEVVAMRRTFPGYVLSQLARLVGGPLPHDMSSLRQPAVVTVTEDCAGEGQFWIRQYGRATGFPQVIHSSKRFAGPTGIEEYIGCGIGMALQVAAGQDALIFKSDHYFLQVGSLRFRLPSWLSPGKLTITHRDLGDTRFLFSLTLTSRLFGELIHQDALFHDMEIDL